MGKTVAEKIFDAHFVDNPYGDIFVIKLDAVFCHEITTPVAVNDLVSRGKDRVFDPSKIKAVIDHVTPAKDSKTALQGKIIRDWARRNEIKDFFDLFSITMISFQQHNFAKLKELETWEDKSYKTTLHQRLKEQYHVLRHIWGDNGELKEEDITYYKWMHYKNLSDMHSSSFLGKFKPWIRRVLYEGVFGWGVQLPRIVLSTLGMVVIFTAIYYFMFQADPSLDVQWDGAPLKGPIDVWKSFVFAIQTTFSAGLGDWAPIGSGPIKIPMTINAVLGLLFVTFLIGAYGRKMLR